MAVLTSHWSFDPVVVAAIAAALVHGIGVHRLNRGAPAERTRRRRREAAFFDGGLAILVVAVCSPLDYWSDAYLFLHMVQHLLLLFAAPAAIVAGAPWTPLEHGLPVALRRRLGRFLVLGPGAAPLRKVGRVLRSPLTAIVGLNATVVVWHLPAPLQYSEQNVVVHAVLMHGSFVFFGILLFLQLINSRPFRVTLQPQAQMVAIFTTAIVFWTFAMALGLFSKHTWYPWYDQHEGPLLSPFADQQIAAGIMWVCGDFWAIPAMVRAVRRLMDDRPATARSAASPATGGIAGFNLVGRAHERAKLLDALRDGYAAGDVTGQGGGADGLRGAR